VSESISVQIVQNTVLWNQLFWNTFNWASLFPIRVAVAPIPKNIKTRYLAIVIKVSSSSDFRLFGIAVNFEEQSVSFGLK